MARYIDAFLGISLLIAFSVLAARRLLMRRQRSHLTPIERLAWSLSCLVSLLLTGFGAVLGYAQVSREISFRESDHAKQCAQGAAENTTRELETGPFAWRWRYENCLEEIRATR